MRRSEGDAMFSHRSNARPKLAIIAAGAAGLVAARSLGAGPATADQAQDEQYFAALQQIFPGRNMNLAKAVDNAQKVCGHLERGDAFDAVVNDLHEANPSNDVGKVQQEVQLAKSTYCP